MRTTSSYSPPPSLDGLSLDDFSYAGLNPAHHVQRALPYPTNDHLPILPRAPIGPTRNELRAQAVEGYIRNQQRRDTLADLETYEQLQRRKDALLVDKLRRERERQPISSHSPFPLRNEFSDPMPARNEFGRRPVRGVRRNDDFSLRHDNDWSRPSALPARRDTSAGIRFGVGAGAGGFDERDTFQYSR